MNHLHQKFLLIVGAPKCGTTSLFNYMKSSKSIVSAITKETRFFLDAASPLQRKYCLANGLDKYLKYFPAEVDGAAFMEATPDYMYSADLKEIAFCLPHATFLVIVRNPVDKYLSWFRYCKKRNLITPAMNFSEFYSIQSGVEEFSPSVPVHKQALVQGFYSHFLRELPSDVKERMYIVDFDAFIDNPSGVVESIHMALGFVYQNKELELQVFNSTRNLERLEGNKFYTSLRRAIVEFCIGKSWLMLIGKNVNLIVKYGLSMFYKMREPIKSSTQVTQQDIDFLTRIYKDELVTLKRVEGVTKCTYVY